MPAWALLAAQAGPWAQDEQYRHYRDWDPTMPQDRLGWPRKSWLGSCTRGPSDTSTEEYLAYPVV